MSKGKLFPEPPSFIFLYCSHHFGGKFVAGPISLISSDQSDPVPLVSSIETKWDMQISLLSCEHLLVARQGFPCLDGSISESLVSRSRDKTERLKLPEMWLWGRPLGSRRDLLVMQMDVIVLG